MARFPDLAVLAMVALLLFSVAGFAGPAGAVDHEDSASAAADSQQNEPPTAAFSYSPATPEPGDTVVLNGSASNDPDGEIAEYRWDLDGDGETDTTGGPNARVAFPRAGTYEVTLTVLDEDGASDSVTNEVVVAGNLTPNARISASPTEVEVGDPVTLNATASNDPDGRIQTWEIDTNGTGSYDRTFSSPPILQTNYAEPGTYQVSLRVTDNDGLTDTATVEVVVQSRTPATTAAGEGTTTVRTGTVTRTGEGPAGPDTGGSSLFGAIPGGGLTVGGVGLVILLLIGGLFLYGRSGGTDRRRRGESGRGPIGRLLLALVMTVVLIGVPVAVLRRRMGGTTGLDADLALAFIEMAALFLPALMLLLFVWQQLPGQQGRGSSGVGMLTPTGFRLLGLGLSFLAVVSVVVGLAGLLLALPLSGAIAIAGAFVVGGIGITALALAIAVVTLALG